MAFNQVLNELEANPEYTNCYSSASNGKAERAIRSIIEMSRALRIGGNLPMRAWAECAVTAAYIQNRLPTSTNKNSASPYEVVFKTKPDLSNLRVVGATAYVHQKKPLRGPLDPTARVGCVVGYAPKTTGWRILMDRKTGEIIESADVVFCERPSIVTTTKTTDRVLTHADEADGGVLISIASLRPAAPAAATELPAPAAPAPVVPAPPAAAPAPAAEDEVALLEEELLADELLEPAEPAHQ
jgi:hypothetical protein